MRRDRGRNILFCVWWRETEGVSVTCPRSVFLIITLNYTLLLWNRSPKYCVESFVGRNPNISGSTGTQTEGADLVRKVVSAFCLLCVWGQSSFRGQKQDGNRIAQLSLTTCPCYMLALHKVKAVKQTLLLILMLFQDWCLLLFWFGSLCLLLSSCIKLKRWLWLWLFNAFKVFLQIIQRLRWMFVLW